MRLKIILLFLIAILVSVTSVNSDSDDHFDLSKAEEILEKKLPPESLTEEEYEILGEYFMELMHGDNHEFMDDMMGGEGSETLRSAHINMGRNFYTDYLRTGIVQSSRTISSGMMGSQGMISNNWGYMMFPGSGHFFFGIGFIGLLLFTLFWGAVIWLIYQLIQKPKIKKQSPLDILKIRYAKGEITKKDFDKKKKELG